MSEDVTPAHLVSLNDLRLNRQQFNEDHLKEYVTCGPSCAGDFVQDRGFDVSRAKDATSNIAHIPHLSGEDGHWAGIIRTNTKNTQKLIKQGAKCAHCGGAVGR